MSTSPRPPSRHCTRVFAFTFASLFPLCAFTCEPEVGMPCDDDPARVARVVDVEDGVDNLVRDVTLRNCTQALCVSTGGSRPYCTVDCGAVGDGACPVDEGFRCANIAPFANPEDSAVVCAASPEVIEARDVEMGRSNADDAR